MEPDKLLKAVVGLVELVARLRGPDGCPWDAKQTEETIKVYLLEEAYEVLDAIERSAPQDICQELGDLLFQIVFLTQMAAEREEFDLIQVMEGITEKMIRRHPHVFGEKEVRDAKEVAANWAQIKRIENGAPQEASSSLRSIPSDLPALLRAHRLSERASKVNFDWPDAAAVWLKIEEVFAELRTAISERQEAEATRKIGDLVFSLASLARHQGLNAESVLRSTNRRFLKRFEMMETKLQEAGLSLEEATRKQMEQTWEAVRDKVA
jgi:tetrapyrrole methylase family protein/MazG family protein/ATP diphosphatase